VGDLAGIRRVELRAHPLLRQRTDRPGVTSGKTSQVSAQHAVAVSLVRGRAGLAEFSDEAVRDTALRAVSERLAFVEDASLGVEAAEVALDMADGRRLVHRVDAAHGSLAAPLSDDELSAKCRELAHYGGSGVAVEPLLQALWDLDDRPDVARALFNTLET
jgi:2-methylcitrate dehydratase PrpD